MKLLFKYGTIYREVMTTPTIDVCTVVKLLKDDRILVNKWVAHVAEILEDTAPGLVHPCPYTASRINKLWDKILFFFIPGHGHQQQKRERDFRSITFSNRRLQSYLHMSQRRRFCWKREHSLIDCICQQRHLWIGMTLWASNTVFPNMISNVEIRDHKFWISKFLKESYIAQTKWLHKRSLLCFH